MRDLNAIELDFLDCNNSKLNGSKKNHILLRLMNELERDYGTFVLNPSTDELNNSGVILYRKISDAREI